MSSNPLHIVSTDQPWYSNGLRFKCTECGQCCTGAPGYTWVSDKEIQVLAGFLGLSISEFGQKYLRYVNGRYALLEDPHNYDCIFLKDKKCSVYIHRPDQCRTFPWWMQNLKSQEDWKEAASYCEGISESAPLVSYESIQEQLSKDL